jgi:hypothetical protein
VRVCTGGSAWPGGAPVVGRVRAPPPAPLDRRPRRQRNVTTTLAGRPPPSNRHPRHPRRPRPSRPPKIPGRPRTPVHRRPSIPLPPSARRHPAATLVPPYRHPAPLCPGRPSGLMESPVRGRTGRKAYVCACVALPMLSRVE